MPTLAELQTQLQLALSADARWAAARLATAESRLARGQAADRILAEVAARLELSVAEVARRGTLALTISYPEHLPVSQRRDEIIAALRQHPVLVLTGETGSGKTTQLPKMLLEAGFGRRGVVALTQPRRLAAVAMAARISEECQAGAGVIVHSVRFDDHAGPDTVIRVMTDGLLLAEVANDPDLSRYDAIIIDEAHERSLNIDLLLGLIQILRRRRPELAVVISSASIEAERFARYFNAPIIAVEGRLYPVELRYAPPADEEMGYLAATLSAIRALADAGESGDILVFLPTERDIIEAQRRLDDLPGTAVLPLFSRLTPAEQQRVFQPPAGRAVRKVVLSTNIAETSLTIPGIRFVIDTGLARLKRYQAASRTERLPIEAISRASATQRAGRAGRVEAGVCIRLYAEDEFARRDAYTAPEILRSNLAGVMLTCLAMELGEPQDFPWLDAPAVGSWEQARTVLEELGAIGERGARSEGARERGSEGTSALRPLPSAITTLTPLGRTLAALPADPQVARILVAGITEGCPHEACTIAAFLSVQDPRVRPLGQESKAESAQRELVHEAGDLATVLKLWDRWNEAGSTSAKSRMCDQLYLGFRRMREWADVRHQLWSAMRDAGRYQLPPHGAAPGDWPLDPIHRAVLAGLLGNVLMFDREKRAYRGAGDRELHVHPGSALRAGKPEDGKKAPPPMPWLVACEIVETSRLFARLCAPIDPEWVVALAGERVKRRHRDPQWHPGRKQVVCIETVTWRGLPVRDGRMVPYERVDRDDAHRVFISQALVNDDGLREPAVIERNRQVFHLAERLRHRLRDPSLDVQRQQLVGWYADRFRAARLSTLDQLRAWVREHGESALSLSLAELTSPEIAARAEAGAPDAVTMGGQTFPLFYRFIPGDALDGVTLELAENEIHRIDLVRLDWLVPAWWPEMVEAYVAQLPKDSRRVLIPQSESLPKIVSALSGFVPQRAFGTALTEILRAQHGIRAASFDPAALPAHLRPRFVIKASDGAVVYEGRDPAFLASQAGGADHLRLLRAEWETEPGVAWPGDLPADGGRVEAAGHVGWVALGRMRSASGLVAFRRTVYASREAAQAWQIDGLDAGLEAHLGLRLEALALAPVPAVLGARCEKFLGVRLGAFRRHAALSAVCELERGPIRDAAAWQELCVQAERVLTACAGLLDALADRSATAAELLAQRRRQGAKTLQAAQAATSVALVSDRLLAPGWSQRLPWSAVRRLDLYLMAQAKRLEGQSKVDARVSDRIQGLFTAWDEVLGGDASRLLLALGLTRTVRELAACLQESCYALATGANAQAAEMRLRLGLQELEHTLGDARDRLAESRQQLLETSRLTGRIVVKERRLRLEQELSQALRDFPDLSLGCDLSGQRQAVRALVARVLAAV